MTQRFFARPELLSRGSLRMTTSLRHPEGSAKELWWRPKDLENNGSFDGGSKMNEINILLIEDKDDDAKLLQDIIKSEGYKVWRAESGAEALKLLKNTPFAIVITELHMPDMNGIEITRNLLKHNPQICVLVITPYTFINSAVEAMEKGAYRYITKPIIPAEVKIVLKHAFERFSLMTSDMEKEHFAEMSVKDGLTGVYNRRFLKVFVTNKITALKRVSEKFSILMVDLDHFKDYNDKNGHPAGDELLRKMSKLFQESVRSDDIVFRYGGEEFLLFLDHTDKKGANLVAERIRNTVTLYMPTTISIGVGTFPEDGDNLDGLVSKVDEALYKAKESGRNKVCTV
jgi:two-component system cell cycle response regulator